MPASAGALASLVSVKVRDVFAPSNTLLAPNCLVNLGAGKTSKHCGVMLLTRLTKLDSELASLVKSGEFDTPHWVGFNAPLRLEMPLTVTVQTAVPPDITKSFTAMVAGAEKAIDCAKQPAPFTTAIAFFNVKPAGKISKNAMPC